ncbi:uncharacterized protein LOC114162314 [Vigna unguiculata]|uniref:uncharacterized protein LOC114162314 n=1 Tax=Vigna unguiculata TaxID=3917 RepID=UPI001015DFA9|nr:uncharacterized protein LOC114162314 [Vigna unguiculata]
MATVPPPSPPPRSASGSGNTSPTGKVEAATNNGNCDVDDKKPNFTDGLDHLDSPQCIERFRKYDNDYAHRLVGKYFSNKNLYGGNVFDVQLRVKDEMINSSGLTCYRSYADPVVGFEDQSSNGSTPPADSQASIPNGKHVVKKN